MRASRQQIENVATSIAEQIGQLHNIEVVDVEYVRERGDFFLRIYIDKPEGVNLDDCQTFSVSFSEAFDEVDPIPGSYSLEVSSPGLERPLKRAHDFQRFAGRLVQVRTYAPVMERKQWKGRLIGLEGDQVILEVDNEQVALPFEMVSSARLVADFEEILRQGAKKK